MTKLKFVGDLPLWTGLLLALLVVVMSWRYYRRETSELSGRLRWWLPTLRSFAFLLGVLVLTQPVLQHRKVIGELGNVRIYIDASQSMGLLDRHLGVDRKLLIAEQQGWLEPGTVDTGLRELIDATSSARLRAVSQLQTSGTSAESLRQLRDDLLAGVKTIQTHASWGQVPTDGEPPDESDSRKPADRLADIVRQLNDIDIADNDASIASARETMKVTCDTLQFLHTLLDQQLEAQVQQLISSNDESIRSALAVFDDTPRWRRAERSLLETSSAVFTELKQHHNVQILALHDQTSIELLNSISLPETPATLLDVPDAATSDLASGIVSSQNAAITSQHNEESDSAVGSRALNSQSPSNTAIVLLTDGQHNSGPSPLQTARILGGQGIAFYPISFGATQQAPDVSVTGLEYPEMVFQKDRVRGTMIIQDSMPAGQPILAQVTHEGEVLWQQEIKSDNSGERRIDFDFSVDEIVTKAGSQFATAVKQNAIPLAFDASIAAIEGEAELENNSRSMRFAAITQKYKLLILDGRSRWETRYLRNVFERDTQWDVNVVIAGPGNDSETLPRGDQKDMFPASRERLFEYDLIVFGELAPQVLADQEFAWIQEFVEIRGGGIIFVDGNRGRLSQLPRETLGALLPVEWSSNSAAVRSTMLQLTDRGIQEPALNFGVDPNANQRFWNELPPPQSLNPVTASPGAEVLVEAMTDGSATPMMVTRSFGAGRVLYLASDETWRWRYKAADTYHQRIWNQLARYVMPRPFAASDEFLSIDTGPVNYADGDSANIRVRLLGLDGKPATDSTVDALLWKDGRIASTISLEADPNVPGIYRGNSGGLVEGNYEVSVQASGFSQEALKARGQFIVLAPESGELQKTGCNEDLLKQMAIDSGGAYLREEQIGKLAALLSPLSSGRVVDSTTELWQSYWWFAAIISILALEWFLRKRAGLL